MAASAGTRRSTMNKRRHGLLAIVLPWLKRFGLVLLVLCFFTWLGAWLWMSGTIARTAAWAEQKTLTFTADMGFRVNNIMVEGRVYTNSDLLLGIINAQKGDPLLAFDPLQVQGLIEKLAWVKAVHVERRFPDTIYINITEHMPLALFQQKGEMTLIDETGAFVTRDDLGRFKDLPIVIGEGGAAKAPEFIALLKAEQILYSRIKALRWIGGRRWDIEFNNGIIAKMPEQDVSLALRRLGQAQMDEKVLDKDIVQIDVRDPARLIVRAAPGAIEALEKKQTPEKPGNNI